jgi:hypothetical protein
MGAQKGKLDARSIEPLLLARVSLLQCKMSDLIHQISLIG